LNTVGFHIQQTMQSVEEGGIIRLVAE
jgi:hypothetical protein